MDNLEYVLKRINELENLVQDIAKLHAGDIDKVREEVRELSNELRYKGVLDSDEN